MEVIKKILVEDKLQDASMFTDDFEATFPGGNKMPGQPMRDFVGAILKAAPDFSFNDSNWVENADGSVSCDIHVTATFTAPFSHPQAGNHEPNGKKAELPTERLTITLRDGKMATQLVESDKQGGPPEVLRQWLA